MVRVRLTKLRPFRGSCLICSSVTVVDRSELEVWTSGVWATISTDSVMAPTSSLMSARTRWSTPTWTFDSDTVLKPLISPVTV